MNKKKKNLTTVQVASMGGKIQISKNKERWQEVDERKTLKDKEDSRQERKNSFYYP